MTREDLRRRGEEMREKLQGGAPAMPAGFGTLLTEAVFGAIWSRPGLALGDRVLVSLAAVSVVPARRALRRLIGAALDAGLSAEAVREVLVQTSLYAGFTVAEETLAMAAEVFGARGIAFPADPPCEASLETLTDRGRKLMATLHGDRAQRGYASPDNPAASELYPMAIQYGYGEIWFRPGLEPRQRALVAVAAFTGLRLTEQVAKFGQSALNVGLTKTEVLEAVVQTAPHSGFPPALNALVALGNVFK